MMISLCPPSPVRSTTVVQVDEGPCPYPHPLPLAKQPCGPPRLKGPSLTRWPAGRGGLFNEGGGGFATPALVEKHIPPPAFHAPRDRPWLEGGGRGGGG